MALTADQEARVIALINAVRKLPPPGTLSQGITDKETLRAVRNVESYLAQLVSRLGA